MKRRAVLFAGCAAAGAAASVALKPSTRASQQLAAIDLEQQIPLSFDGWSVDRSTVPVLPNPSVRAALDRIYAQLVARSYLNARGQRVMLSIAYGEDQGTDATASHRPEFCYSSQGFSVAKVGEQPISVNGHTLNVRRLIGTMGSRFEPITYWVTLNDRALLPGLSRKLEQIKLGLAGHIPDGMLVRVSTTGLAQQPAFDLQDDFLRSLQGSLPAALRPRYFGAA